jgi:hypothetical protein
MTSFRNVFNPPSCSYRTSLVRHPSCSHPWSPLVYIHFLYSRYRWLWDVLCHYHCEQGI